MHSGSAEGGPVSRQLDFLDYKQQKDNQDTHINMFSAICCLLLVCTFPLHRAIHCIVVIQKLGKPFVLCEAMIIFVANSTIRLTTLFAKPGNFEATMRKVENQHSNCERSALLGS